MSKSIFREVRIPYLNYDLNSSTQDVLKKIKTHDNGIPRAREYSLHSIIYFTPYKELSIKELIETDFDYFLWLPRNINGFTYTKDVLGYAEKCLKFLEILQTYTDNTSSKIGYALGQVRIMLRYESLLDSGQDENLMMAYKSMVDVDFYRTIHNKPLENFIRQYFRKMNYSREHRRKYFLEISK